MNDKDNFSYSNLEQFLCEIFTIEKVFIVERLYKYFLLSLKNKPVQVLLEISDKYPILFIRDEVSNPLLKIYKLSRARILVDDVELLNDKDGDINEILKKKNILKNKRYMERLEQVSSFVKFKCAIITESLVCCSRKYFLIKHSSPDEEEKRNIVPVLSLNELYEKKTNIDNELGQFYGSLCELLRKNIDTEKKSVFEQIKNMEHARSNFNTNKLDKFSSVLASLETSLKKLAKQETELIQTITDYENKISIDSSNDELAKSNRRLKLNKIQEQKQENLFHIQMIRKKYISLLSEFDYSLSSNSSMLGYINSSILEMMDNLK
jgi:hypothetical protein